MRTGRPKVIICVTSEEEILLQQAKRSHNARVRDKARLILVARERSLSISGLSELLGRSTKTVQRWFAKWKTGGYSQLMTDTRGPGKAARVDVETQKEMREKLEKGVMGVEEMRKWLEEKGIKLSYRGTHYWMGKLGRS